MQVWYLDNSPTGQLPNWYFSEDRFPTGTSPTKVSATDISPARYFPDGDVLDWTFFHYNISPTGYFHARTFPQPYILALVRAGILDIKHGINYAWYFSKYSTNFCENLHICNSTYYELIDYRKYLMTSSLFLITSPIF